MNLRYCVAYARSIVFAAAVVLAGGSAFGEDRAKFTDQLEWSFRASILTILEDNGLDGDPSPVLPSAGIAMAYPFLPVFALEPSLDIYSTYYGYSEILARAYPAAIENRSALVIGSVFAVTLVYRVALPKDMRLRFFVGPAADLRLCLTADGLEGDDLEDASEQTSDVTSYFWGAGRWFFPTAGFGFDIPALPHLLLGLDARLWFPVYRLWTGEDLPTREGWRFAVGLRLTFR